MGVIVFWSMFCLLLLMFDFFLFKDDWLCCWFFFVWVFSNGLELEYFCEVLIGIFCCICIIVGECDDVLGVFLFFE